MTHLMVVWVVEYLADIVIDVVIIKMSIIIINLVTEVTVVDKLVYIIIGKVIIKM